MAKFKTPAIVGGSPALTGAPTWAEPATERTRELVARVLETGDVCGYAGNDAPARTELEGLCALQRGFSRAIASSNGTDAIEIALISLLAVKDKRWLRGRSKVIVSVLTWVPGTLAAIRDAVLRLLGIEVEFVLVDSRADDWTADEHQVLAALKEYGDETLAVVIPSLLDTFPQLDPMIRAAWELDVPLIHDGAQTGGAFWPGMKPDAETESFQAGTFRGKYSGEGGLTYFDDLRAAKVARRITDCGNHAGGALDPAPWIEVDDILPVSGNSRMGGLTAAAALGRVFDLVDRRELAVVRRVRREIGTELVAPDGLVVFRTPPIQAWWEDGPTYGFGAELTAEAEAAYHLTADHWREIFAAEGFADDANKYRYGVRRPYLDATRHPEWARMVPARDVEVSGRRFPRAGRIHRFGLMFHVRHLTDPATPEAIIESITKAVANIDGLRRHFGVGGAGAGVTASAS